MYKNPDAMSIRICNPKFTLDRASLANQVYPLTIYPLTRYILLSKKNKKTRLLAENRANERRSGTSRNRTGDTRIFSPMLYQLS